MKYLVILFAVVAIVAAFPEPEQERERRGILGAPALTTTILTGPKLIPAPIVAAPAVKLVAGPAWGAAPLGIGGWGAKAW